MPVKSVLLIRHGATAGNLERRYIGRTDEPLCQEGLTQIRALARQGLTADVVFASPARRTRQTAALLFPDRVPRLVEALWETDFGAFEGKTAQELTGDPAYQAWLDSFCQGPIPGGEAVADFRARCAGAFRSCLDQVGEGETAAFVLHGGCIMAILAAWQSPPCGFYDHHLPNGGLLRCRWEGEALALCP